MTQAPAPQPRPLDGVRVIELTQLVAGPFAGTLLGWFGAEVIKIEPPGGDPLREWRGMVDGTSLWWRSLARNKRSVVIDLKQPDGVALVRALLAKADVLVENYRPGVLESLSLAPADLTAQNPRLVISRVSGFGQDGPYRERPGYASVCEAIGGLRHVTGMPGQTPVRANLSLGDSLAGLHAALGVMMALYHRDRAAGGSGAGQLVDTAIYESVFNMMESVIPEFDALGENRGPSGTTITGIVPSGTYPTLDADHVVIGANNDRVFARLAHVIGRPEWATDPRFATNPSRVAHQLELEEAITAWTRQRSRDAALALLEAAEVPCAQIYDAAAMRADPHFAARNMFESRELEGRTVTLPALSPKLSQTPGRTEWAGARLGAFTREVLRRELALTDERIDELARRGVIDCGETPPP